ncbi:MAG: flagellar hook-basal body complex protein [Desulfamplus sp.]|nr:flagellar hook-basal body complex protein [Desulfamplus sp.]
MEGGSVVEYAIPAGAANGDQITFTAELLSPHFGSAAAVNYPKAEIVHSDDQNIWLKLNDDDDEIDLKIFLDKEADTGDTISFDINAEKDLHVQGVDGSRFIGETAKGNTTIQINDPTVMNIDSEDLSILWYPGENVWRWGNPQIAADNDTLVPRINYAGAPASGFTPNLIVPSSENTSDASAMTKYVKDINLQYDFGGDNTWYWDMPFKETGEDIINEDMSLGTVNATRTLASNGNVFQDRGDYQFTYDNTIPGWSYAAGTTAPVTPPAITGNTTSLAITTASGSEIKYFFDSAVQHGDTIEFTIEPSPPLAYPNATINGTGGDVRIDFDGGTAATVDLVIDLTSPTAGAAGVTAPVAGNTFMFTLNPDTPPEEYPNAKLTGDQKKAVIDIDGSGNEDDKNDVVFSFKSPLDVVGNKDISAIMFNVSGSTSWKEIEKNEITQSGYFSFIPDFLGGENGSTSNPIEFDIGAKFDGLNFQNDSMATTQYAKPSSTVFQTADGYAAGDLEGVDISIDGAITGIYSNGELIPLFRVSLAKFLNNNGLFNVGGNMFRETRDSGNAITNRPGQNGLGALSPSSLEMSNVDISEEFVSMITTQRGFQANSKTVTTVDAMMETVIQMKR